MTKQEIDDMMRPLPSQREWYYGEHEQIDEFSHKNYPNAERGTVVELT